MRTFFLRAHPKYLLEAICSSRTIIHFIVPENREFFFETDGIFPFKVGISFGTLKAHFYTYSFQAHKKIISFLCLKDFQENQKILRN